jgi:ubiquinone/menaquinone biosynthesis C-methylase UbiE
LLAARLYDPLIAHGTLRLLGGDMESRIAEQGRRAVAAASGGHLLDIPVGTGLFTVASARRHHGLVVGVDLAEGMVAKARSAAVAAGVTNLAVARADAHRLPFPDTTFAAATCWNGLQAIPDRERALGELARVLRPGGTLCVAAITVGWGAALAGPRAARRLPTFFVSQWEIRDALLHAGFVVDSVATERLAIFFEATKPPALTP